MKHQFGIKIGDVILMAIVLLSAVLMFISPLFSAKADYAEIVIVEKNEKQVISLNKNATYNVTSRGIALKICVENGEIFVKESNCRDGICRNTPSGSHIGQSIVCAPAGVVIRILGEGAGVDGISG